LDGRSPAALQWTSANKERMAAEACPPHDTATLYRLQVRGIRAYAMFLTDTRGTILTWNEGVEQLFGYSEHDFVGQDASIIFTPEDRAADIPATEMRRACEQGQAANIRWHQRKNGSRLYTHGSLQALRNEAGELLGYAKVVSDETKQKSLQDALTESNAALSQFSHAVAHDLQEPGRSVRAYAELLARRYQSILPEEAQQILRHLEQGAARMQQLIQDLLAWSHVAAEQEPGASVSLNEDFETACTQLRVAIEESSATITHDPLPVVNANRGQMVRLFLNLLSNSLKYRDPNRPPVVHVAATRQEDEWTISVRDNGRGFDQRYAEEIFGVFKRLHRDDHAGTGMGLALAKRIVERHGGRIWAESEPGRGATFCFTLPAVDPS
jgi:PAS domain S-box-containing protein